MTEDLFDYKKNIPEHEKQIENDEEDHIFNEEIMGTMNEDTSTNKETKDEITEEDFKNILGSQMLDDTNTDIDNVKEGTHCVPLSTFKDINEALNQSARGKSKEQVVSDLEDPNTLVSSLYSTISEFFTNQQKYSTECFSLIKEQNKNITSLSNTLTNKIEGVLDIITKRPPSPKEKVLSGKRAEYRVTSIMQGLKRIPLFNSGFFITVKGSSLIDLSRYYDTCAHMNYEYGRELGIYSYLYADFNIKYEIMHHLFSNALIDTNIKDFNKMSTTDILKFISFHDYETILHGQSCLMFREGLDIKYVCGEPLEDGTTRCGYEDVVKKADLSKLKVINTDLLSAEMIDFMNSNVKVSTNDVLEYQKKIKYPFDKFRFSHMNYTSGSESFWEIKFRVPTMDNYFTYGADFNNEMLSMIGVDFKSMEAKDIEKYIGFNFNKIFIPWIYSIAELPSPDCTNEDEYISITYNDSDSVKDRKTIKSILDVFQFENIPLDIEIDKFTKISKITHVAYNYNTCPKCGKVPSIAVDGFIPFDVQSYFFTLSRRRLIATKSRM